MKILVVDDEPLARDRLRRLLARLTPETPVIEAETGSGAIAACEQQAPEIVLLDINMPGMSGLEVAELLSAAPCPPAIIFCTAHEGFALQALQHQTAAYLLKPVREVDLKAALAKAARANRLQVAALETTHAEATPARQTISSESLEGFTTLQVKDICCFIAREKYVAAITPETELLIGDTLKDLEVEFADRFLRVHRNALVAPDHILRLEKDDDGSWHVVLRGLNYRPGISRRHLGEVKEQLRRY